MLYNKIFLPFHPGYITSHLLIPNSQSSFSPSPFHLVAITSLFSMSVSLFLYCKLVSSCHILDATYNVAQNHISCDVSLSPSDLLRLKICSPVHVAPNGMISFFFVAEYCFIEYMKHIIFSY